MRNGLLSFSLWHKPKRIRPGAGKSLRGHPPSIDLGETMHVFFEIASAILVTIPLFAVARAYRRTRSARFLFAFVAFAVLELRFLSLIAMHTFVAVDHLTEETLDYLTDLTAITMFAAAFLYGTGWKDGRALADVS